MTDPKLEKLLEKLNPKQYEAATLNGAHSLVLAGAGSGKTSTIVSRAAYLIGQGVDPRRIRILTFTRRAAGEIVSRVRSCLGERAMGLGASTFHAWCLQIIHAAPEVFGAKNFTIIDQDDQNQLFKGLRGKRKKDEFPPAKLLAEIYSFSRNTGKSIDEVLWLKAPEYEDLHQEIKTVLTGYEKKKRKHRYVDYDDLLILVADKLNTDDRVCRWLSSKYDHVLIDEMQDTNNAQFRLIKPLQSSVIITAVGDDAQSIYGWRGADFAAIHSFTSHVPGAKVLKLQENYRSTQEILDLSNWLLEESSLNYDKRLSAVRGSGRIPELRDFYNEWDEARWLAADLIVRHEQGAPWKDHMVLVRSGFAGRIIESIFLENSVPYKFIGGAKLLEAAHIRDLLSVLRIVANKQDEIAWIRYLTLFPGVGDSKAAKVLDRALHAESLDEMKQALGPESKISSQEAAKAYEAVHSSQSDVSEAIKRAFEILEKTLQVKYSRQDWEKRKKDYALLMKLGEKHTSISSFIEQYLLDPMHPSQVDRSEHEDVVSLITVHSAKGTEAPTCYVINVSPGSYPSPYDKEDSEIEESRRVLYVALTRAQNDLIVTRRGLLNRPGVSSEENGDSYFFEMLPPHLVNYYDAETSESPF